jgi:hypothetical protein
MLRMRTFVSIGLTPAACIFTSTLDGVETAGAGISAAASTSGPPGAFISMAFMVFSYACQKRRRGADFR